MANLGALVVSLLLIAFIPAAYMIMSSLWRIAAAQERLAGIKYSGDVEYTFLDPASAERFKSGYSRPPVANVVKPKPTPSPPPKGGQNARKAK